MIFITKNPNTATTSMRIERVDRRYIDGRDVERPATPSCSVDTYNVTVHFPDRASVRKLIADLETAIKDWDEDEHIALANRVAPLDDDDDDDEKVPLVTDAYDMEGRQ